jgi:magnesium-transporting ATPase (P-type)
LATMCTIKHVLYVMRNVQAVYQNGNALLVGMAFYITIHVFFLALLAIIIMFSHLLAYPVLKTAPCAYLQKHVLVVWRVGYT